MKKLLLSVVCTVAFLGAGAVPAAAQHGDQDRKVPATVSFGVGLNTATPNNPPNHRVHPQDIHIETGNVVNFLVAGFHQIFVYKPGVTLGQIVAPGSSTFVDQHTDLLYYQGLVPAGGTSARLAGDDEPVERLEPHRTRRVFRARGVSGDLQRPRALPGRDARVRHGDRSGRRTIGTIRRNRESGIWNVECVPGPVYLAGRFTHS